MQYPPPTFDGSPLFGNSVSIAVSFKPRERQENGYFGVNGIEVIDGGSRGGQAVASGVLYGWGAYGLALAEAQFLDRNDGKAKLLTDTLGRQYDAILDSFEPKGRVRRDHWGNWFRSYEARFLVLQTHLQESVFPFDVPSPYGINAFFASSYFTPFYFGGVNGEPPPPPPPPPFSPADVARSWLTATAITATDGDRLSAWPDSATSPLSFVVDQSDRRPLYVADRGDGKPIVRYDGSSRQWFVVPMPTGITGAEVFVVSKNATGLAGTATGAPVAIGGADSPSIWPWSDGLVYHTFGRDVQSSFTAPSGMNAWGLWNFRADATEVVHVFNGQVVGTVGPGTFVWPTAGFIGAHTISYHPWYFVGDIAAFVLCDRVLTTTERAAMTAHLTTEWGLPS